MIRHSIFAAWLALAASAALASLHWLRSNRLAGLALAGAALPLFLTRINVDPALAGGVILTTVTDVVGFVSFLGLATLFYA